MPSEDGDQDPCSGFSSSVVYVYDDGTADLFTFKLTLPTLDIPKPGDPSNSSSYVVCVQTLDSSSVTFEQVTSITTGQEQTSGYLKVFAAGTFFQKTHQNQIQSFCITSIQLVSNPKGFF